jgi:hypothetical protein
MPLTPPYSLLTRTAKGSQLTIEEMDGNLLWLSTTLSGSINSITGSLGISGSNIEIVTSLFNLFSETLITGSVTINPNSIPNPISGSYTLGGSVTFNGDLTIASGSELIIPAGVAFTLNGALINNGDLVNSGSYINLSPTSPYMTLSVLGNVSASAYYGNGSNLTGITAATASYSFFAVSASYAVSASHEIIKEVSSSYADFAVTASYVDLVAGPNVTINRVGTSFEISSSGGGGTIDTGSFATTGSNSFVGSQVITGSLILHNNGFSSPTLNFENDGTSTPISQIEGQTYGGGIEGGLNFNYYSGGSLKEGFRLRDGKIGIGTINPTVALTVLGSISASGNIYANTGSFEYVYSNIYEGSGSGTVVNIEGDVSASGYISASYFVGDG